ncbi:UvrD-helicase domain-containing protein [Agrococcus sp. HG114]|uniref:UvrD-helicase domain-containing protein n=1 Tax=Agrococcus sp. HG114 TaxID=2969757 RepID=UPI00215A968A|nr:ATP-dependent helicase [Agrococcus sp. HG114]MCR8670109.1 ATP-dependent helicase [Agrococcus sp. HG114]
MAKTPIGAQRQAVDCPADRLLVVAPPGCGKTELLAMRAERMIRDQTVRPGRRLLAITFTNRARDNLRERLRQQLGEAQMRTSVSTMNFHELAARVVEAHAPVIGLERGYIGPNPAWLRRALAARDLGRAREREVKNLLQSVKREPLTDGEVLARLARDFDALAIEEARREENYVDYGDLLRYAQLILRNDRVAALFQAHFDALLVDEFQDLSLQQYEITQRISRHNATYVGDPFQGIYGWAGAAPEEIQADLESNCEVMHLTSSFRSSPAVLKVVNSVSADLDAPALEAAEPKRWGKSGGHAYAVAYPNDAAEADGIVELTDYLADKYPEERIGVICRAEYRRSALERAYDRAAHQPQFWDIALDTPRVARLVKLHARHLDPGIPFGEQVDELEERMSAALPPTEIETLREVHEACEQLREYESAGTSVPALVSRIRDHQITAAITPGVHVLNAHVGKGQQFDWVIVMGLEDGHVPSVYSKTPAAIVEDERILLVMVSRARKGLFLTHARSNTNQYGRVFHNEPSRWWDQMAEATKPLVPSIAKLMKTSVGV